MSLIEALIEKAKLNPKRVALPECEADKTLLAARRVLDEGIGVPVLVNDPAVIKETAARVGVSLEGMEMNFEDIKPLLISALDKVKKNVNIFPKKAPAAK